MKGITYKGEAYIKATDAEVLANEWYERGYRQGVHVCIAACDLVDCAEGKEAILETEHELSIVEVKTDSGEQPNDQ